MRVFLFCIAHHLLTIAILLLLHRPFANLLFTKRKLVAKALDYA